MMLHLALLWPKLLIAIRDIVLYDQDENEQYTKSAAQ